MQEATVTDIFRPQLTNEWTRKRLPKNFGTAYTRASTLRPSETERIFLDVGVKAWFAYHLAKSCVTKHHKGRIRHLRAIAAFEQLSDEKRKSVAIELHDTPVHPTVQKQIANVLANVLKLGESGKAYMNSLALPF